MFEHYYSFFHYCMLSYRYLIFQKRILSKPKWGAQAVVRGGARPPAPRSDGTARSFVISDNADLKDQQNVKCT